MPSISAALLDAARDLLRAGGALMRVNSGGAAGSLVIRGGAPLPGGVADYSVPAIYHERCVLIVDLVGWSQRSMEEQFALVETMNGVFLEADSKMWASHLSFRATQRSARNVWDMYKGTGDGAIFVFGSLLDPSSIRDALAFAAYAMAEMHRRNKQLPPGALNALRARMALAYGPVFVTRDLDAREDILGDAINLCARLVSSKFVKYIRAFTIKLWWIDSSTRIEPAAARGDETSPESGTFSDFVVGVTPSTKNFLYLTDDGVHETKDRVLRAFNLRRRTEIIPVRTFSRVQRRSSIRRGNCAA